MKARKVLTEFQVNQIPHQVLVGPSDTLLEVLRQDLGLKGTKRGCDQGHCGACTVIMNGKTVNACMVLAVQADGKKITTIEGLSTGDRLHPLQEAFIEEGAVQCGFCTPGMILSAKALLDETKQPSEEEIREALSGNLCRCTGYVKIVKAIQKAAQAMDSQGAKSMKCLDRDMKNKGPFKVVGQSPPRHESLAKVTGQARYTDDLDLSGMVYGSILRSPYAHARVLRIDPSEAEMVSGVLAILLPGDVPGQPFNCAGNPPSPILIKDERILTDRPLYAGDRIAAVAALTPEACREALDRLVIEFEPLSAVFEIEDALQKEAPLLHPEISQTNIFKKIDARKGEVEKGFAESEYIFEGEYHTPDVQHVAMEPAGCICHFAADGMLTVWSNTQTPFQDRRLLAELLDLPESRVRVIKPAMGGGFGGRQQIHNQHVAALLSKRVRRPVKIINTREEEMLATTARHGSLCQLKVGVDKGGGLKAFHAKVYLNAGAYCTHSPIVLAAQTRKFQYRIPHYLYEGFGVYTNGPVAGAMRGYGNPQLTFARERMMDKIARELDLDPIQFRMMNHLEIGETIPAHTFPLRSCAIKDCVEGGEEIRRRIDEREGDREKREGATEAWGVAFACHTSGPSNNDGQSSCLILVNDDGSVNLSIGSADIGQGCETTFSQIVAEELGIDLEAVAVTAADTLHAPYDTGTFASGQIYVGGNAVHQAAQDIQERIRAALADHYRVDSGQVRCEKGRFTIIPMEGEEISHSFREAVAKISFGRKGATIIGRSSFKAVESPLPFAVCWARVAVDKAAKTVEVRHIIEAVDVGTAINPEIVRGQVEGGIGMGLGFAMMEQIEFDKRAEKPSSSDLLHYKIPTALDMPQIHVYIAKGSYEPTGPFGAKSVGELPAVPVAAAIANAVSKATGEEIDSLPLSKNFVFKRPWQTKGVNLKSSFAKGDLEGI